MHPLLSRYAPSHVWAQSIQKIWIRPWVALIILKEVTTLGKRFDGTENALNRQI